MKLIRTGFLKEILNIPKNLEPYFDFVICVFFIFEKNLKFAKLKNFKHAKCETIDAKKRSQNKCCPWRRRFLCTSDSKTTFSHVHWIFTPSRSPHRRLVNIEDNIHPPQSATERIGSPPTGGTSPQVVVALWETLQLTITYVIFEFS